MKKWLLGIAIFLTTMIISIPCVDASTYRSTLSLGKGKYVAGATRAYTAGYNSIRIDINSFTKVDGLNYTKLQVNYIEDATNYCFNIGSVVFKIDAKTTYAHDWGNLSTGNRYYLFSTKVDGYSYGGVSSNNVIMTSGSY